MKSIGDDSQEAVTRWGIRQKVIELSFASLRRNAESIDISKCLVEAIERIAMATDQVHRHHRADFVLISMK
jgi:hypothetical protein